MCRLLVYRGCEVLMSDLLTRTEQALIVASEPLTEDRDDWEAVPRNHLLIVKPELQVEFRPIAA